MHRKDLDVNFTRRLAHQLSCSKSGRDDILEATVHCPLILDGMAIPVGAQTQCGLGSFNECLDEFHGRKPA